MNIGRFGKKMAVAAIAVAIVTAMLTPALAGSYVGVTIPAGVQIDGTTLKGGSYKVIVDESDNGMTATFKMRGQQDITVPATWKPADAAATRTTVEFGKDTDGKTRVVAIQFEQESRVLALGTAS